MTGSNRAPTSLATRHREDVHDPPSHRRWLCYGHEGPDSANLRIEIGHSCATHFLTRTLDKVRTEMSLHVLAYNLKRMITIFGVGSLMAAIRT